MTRAVLLAAATSGPPIDSRKPYRPGTDPLAALPFSAEERDELVARVRAASSSARGKGARSRRGVKMSPERLAARRSERAAAREQALAHARSLSGGAR